MAETAAHLVDQVVPPLPVRQWVLAVPKRPRSFLQRDPEALSAALHILLRIFGSEGGMLVAWQPGRREATACPNALARPHPRVESGQLFGRGSFRANMRVER